MTILTINIFNTEKTIPFAIKQTTYLHVKLSFAA